MDQQLQRLKEKNCGLSMCQTYVGAAIHANDLRTTAPSKDILSQQISVISDFGKSKHLKLNASKLEVMRISQQQKEREEYILLVLEP